MTASLQELPLSWSKSFDPLRLPVAEVPQPPAGEGPGGGATSVVGPAPPPAEEGPRVGDLPGSCAAREQVGLGASPDKKGS